MFVPFLYDRKLQSDDRLAIQREARENSTSQNIPVEVHCQFTGERELGCRLDGDWRMQYSNWVIWSETGLSAITLARKFCGINDDPLYVTVYCIGYTDPDVPHGVDDRRQPGCVMRRHMPDQ